MAFEEDIHFELQAFGATLHNVDCALLLFKTYVYLKHVYTCRHVG